MFENDERLSSRVRRSLADDLKVGLLSLVLWLVVAAAIVLGVAMYFQVSMGVAFSGIAVILVLAFVFGAFLSGST